MSKNCQSICLEQEIWELVLDAKIDNHLKNNSQAIEMIIKQWQKLRQSIIMAQKTVIERQKQGVPELPDKYKLKKPVNPMANP
jgi:hypothetical protein